MDLAPSSDDDEQMDVASNASLASSALNIAASCHRGQQANKSDDERMSLASCESPRAACVSPGRASVPKPDRSEAPQGDTSRLEQGFDICFWALTFVKDMLLLLLVCVCALCLRHFNIFVCSRQCNNTMTFRCRCGRSYLGRHECRLR